MQLLKQQQQQQQHEQKRRQPWQQKSLRDYFGRYGDISEAMVMKDPTTRRSRGFGFVTFSDPNSVDKVLTQGTHELDGKKVDPKVAFPRRAHPKMVTRTKKIFVGGLSAPTTLEDVKSYFEQFGPTMARHVDADPPNPLDPLDPFDTPATLIILPNSLTAYLQQKANST
ncbi:hypothetical protein ACLKA7_016079 [Drosophila subpalustris]